MDCVTVTTAPPPLSGLVLTAPPEPRSPLDALASVRHQLRDASTKPWLYVSVEVTLLRDIEQALSKTLDDNAQLIEDLTDLDNRCAAFEAELDALREDLA